MMGRRLSAGAVFGVAVLASLSVHLPVWGALGELAKSLEWDAPVVASADEELTFMDIEPIVIEEELPELERVEPEEEGETPQERSENESEQDDPTPMQLAPEAEPEPEPEPEVRTRPPAATEANPIPVQQHSQDPTVAPPEDTQYIARENNRVDEETVAEVRNMVQDAQEELSVGAQLDPSTEEELGNSAEEEVRETENEDGPDDQMPALEPEEVQDTQAAPEQMGERAQRVQEQNAQEGGEPDYELITINDGHGTFTIRRPIQRGTGGGERGGDSVRGREGRNGARRGNGNAEREGPNLRIGWRQFEGIFGEEQLRQERDEYAQSRLTRQRGNGRREREWTEFRAAIENFVPGVRSGNQTALNARASPFAEYLAALHRRIHIAFHQFIDGLSGDGPMGDLSLAVKLEIVFGADGGITRIGVVNSSGVLPYDFAAFNAVKRATPFPAPPDAIKSGDGQVYVHWTFMRDQPYCHGQNARPFILDNAPAAVAPTDQDALGGLQMNSVVPSGAMPNYAEDQGADGQGDSDGDGDDDDDGDDEPAASPEGAPPARRPRIPSAPRAPR